MLFVLIVSPTDEVLGPAGVLFLQAGMLFKSFFTALLWAMCLFAFYSGQLPSWTHLEFRQVNCFDETCVLLTLLPFLRNDVTDELAEQLSSSGLLPSFAPMRAVRFPSSSSSATCVSPAPAANLLELIFPFPDILPVSQSLFWFIVLCAGSYWTLIAPRVLMRRGGKLRDPSRRKSKGSFPASCSSRVLELTSYAHRLHSYAVVNRGRNHRSSQPVQVDRVKWFGPNEGRLEHG